MFQFPGLLPPDLFLNELKPEMTDSTRESVKAPRSVSKEALAEFLKILSIESTDPNSRYLSLQNKLEGFFNLKGTSDPVSAAQESLDRAIIKITTGTPVSDIDKYCLGIARYVAKERFRREQRETSAFLNFVEILADTSDEQVERINRILKPCFEELEVKDQELLLSYCQVMKGQARARFRRDLAATLNITLLALRMRVTRLRSDLTDCVKKRSDGDSSVEQIQDFEH